MRIPALSLTALLALASVSAFAQSQGPDWLLPVGTPSGGGSFPAGTAAAPSVVVGNATTGLYSLGTTGFGFSVNGVSKFDYGVSTAGTITIPEPVRGNNMSMNGYFQTTTGFSAAGTPLPTCNTALTGGSAHVIDALSPTYLGTYASGGAVIAPVFCNGTNWITD